MTDKPDTPKLEHQMLDLINRTCDGDSEAKEELAQLIAERLKRKCKSLVWEKGCYGQYWQDDEDLLQDAVLQALEALPEQLQRGKQWNDDNHFTAGCKVLAHNLYVDAKRRFNKENEFIDPRPLPDYSSASLHRERLRDITEQWRREMSDQDSEMVRLRTAGYELREISEMLLKSHNVKVSHTLVGRHLKKQFERLRVLLESSR